MMKSITVRKVFEEEPEIRKELSGRESGMDGYYFEMIRGSGDRKEIKKNIQGQRRIGDTKQPRYFEL